MNPKVEALAFRIWAYCDPIDWNCTPQQVADAMGAAHGEVVTVLRLKKWGGRLIIEKRDNWMRTNGRSAFCVAADTIDGGSFVAAFKANGIPVRGKSQEAAE